jgi:hypothetical protein
MPNRFQRLERFAFTLVVLFALTCLATVLDRRNPDLRQDLARAFASSTDLYAVCSRLQQDPCGPYPIQ